MLRLNGGKKLPSELPEQMSSVQLPMFLLPVETRFNLRRKGIWQAGSPA
jgi:hypothetical protein